MNKKEFELISEKRIIHSALALCDGKLESPYGARTYGFPTICRFYDQVIKITDYYTHSLLAEIPYDTLDHIEFSVCSRLTGVKITPYYIYYGRMILNLKTSKKIVIEFKLSELLSDISSFLTLQHVRIIDRLGIVKAAEHYDSESIYEYITKNIDNWSKHYPVAHPQVDDMIA